MATQVLLSRAIWYNTVLPVGRPLSVGLWEKGTVASELLFSSLPLSLWSSPTADQLTVYSDFYFSHIRSGDIVQGAALVLPGLVTFDVRDFQVLILAHKALAFWEERDGAESNGEWLLQRQKHHPIWECKGKRQSQGMGLRIRQRDRSYKVRQSLMKSWINVYMQINCINFFRAFDNNGLSIFFNDYYKLIKRVYYKFPSILIKLDYLDRCHQ